jgi:Multicopper oxidase
VRNVVFENCGGVQMFQPNVNLPSCGWYFAKYNAAYWGGAQFNNLLMMRDADDVGEPSPSDPNVRINFKKEGLFDATQPLFPDMIAGNYEEWTVYNRSFSDHPFHLHQNHVLVTKINGIALPQPEWHDTLDVPAAVCPNNPATCANPVNINNLPPGSITFRTYFNPVTVGCFVAHCHTLNHEDIGMMQRMDILPPDGKLSGCSLDDRAAAAPLIEKFIASRSSFQICSAPRQSRSISDSPASPAD